MSSFLGKNALVIGGSGGIGKQLCRELVLTGASLTVHGGHESEKFDNLVKELQAKCKKNTIKKLVAELNESFFLSAGVEQLIKELQIADIVCVCFGPFLQKKLDKTTIADWKSMAMLNYAFPGFCISSALPNMIEKKWGRFLLFGGTRTYSIQGYKTNAAYAGAKTGVCSLVKSVAYEYAECGITCNAILPGFTKTEYVLPDIARDLENCIPGKKLISTEVIAKSALMLLTTSQMNGVLLNVDCGWNGQKPYK